MEDGEVAHLSPSSIFHPLSSYFRRRALLFHFDDTARDARPGVAGGLALQIVDLGVNDDGAADDVVLGAAADGDVVDGEIDLGLARGVGGEVAQVAGVDRAGGRAAVDVLVGVEVPAGGHQVGRGEVALLMDVDSVL